MPRALCRRIDPDHPEDIVDELRHAFLERYGRQPDGVFTAPGRVNLIGEHTDYNGGLCLPIALPYGTYAAVALRGDQMLSLASLQDDERTTLPLDDLAPGAVDGWARYAAGVVWAAREEGIRTPGLDILVTGTVPVGSGLSSSAALECAIAVAVCTTAGRRLDEGLRRALVDVCVRAEREMAGAPTGGMDQTIALSAKADTALLLDCRDWSTSTLSWTPREAGLALLVIDTGVRHALDDGQYGSRRHECEQAADSLGVRWLREATVDVVERGLGSEPVLERRARHVVTEIARVEAAVELLRANDYQGLGDVFDRSHASLRDDFEVSCEELDMACAAAQEAGAIGARMTGGGFGGSAIALVPESLVGNVDAALADAFRDRGWTPPTLLEGQASDGARILSGTSGSGGMGR